ncbi:MAG: TIGR04282 family arsenosugar biosynthesis glycosyltransferase [Burkholderiaceae bacterium]
MTPATTVIVMAKAPVAGFAKTRLIPTLGAQGAAALALRLLQHAVEQALAAGLGLVELCCAPDQHHPAFASVCDAAGLVATDQGDGDLGARMARAFERRLAADRAVLLIGTDAPALDATMLRRAADALESTDAVFVPALDGGYALVGLRRPAPSLFDTMTWSVPTVMAHTRERLAAAGLRHTELPPLADIDEAADLIHLPQGFLGDARLAQCSTTPP